MNDNKQQDKTTNLFVIIISRACLCLQQLFLSFVKTSWYAGPLAL